MTEEEFLELLGKGSKDENKELIEAVEKVLHEGLDRDKIKHSEEDSDYIAHYGRKGMKWGQNLFGTDRNTNLAKGEASIGAFDADRAIAKSNLETSGAVQELYDFLDYVKENGKSDNDEEVIKSLVEPIIKSAIAAADELDLSDYEFGQVLSRLTDKIKDHSGADVDLTNIYKNWGESDKRHASDKLSKKNDFLRNKEIRRNSIAHSEEDSDNLSHYGIENQKWGVRRGPPYPLSRKQKQQKGWNVKAGPSKERKNAYTISMDERKGKQLSAKDKAKRLRENMDDLTIDEIEKLLKRIELEQKIEDLSSNDNKAAQQKGSKAAKAILDVAGKTILNTVVPLATTYAFNRLVAVSLGDQAANDMFKISTKKKG